MMMRMLAVLSVPSLSLGINAMFQICEQLVLKYRLLIW